MDQKNMIRKALQNIADQQTRKELDLWPVIEGRIHKTHLPRPIFSNSIIKASFIAIFTVFTVAAAFFYWKMVDKGLQTAQEEGLISNLSLTAQPFINLSEASKPTYEVKASSGLSATLNWAYADINRVAFQLTVNGLTMPQNVDVKDLVCIPNIRQNSGSDLISYSPDAYPIRIDSDKPGSPIEITYLYVFRHPLDHNKQKYIDFDISFRFGACSPAKWNDYSGPTPIPIPNIASFDVSFQIPVHPGRLMYPHQSVVQDHLTLTLDEVSLSPSFVAARLCFDPDQADVRDPFAVLLDAQIEENETAIPNNLSAPLEPEKTTENEMCQRIWFSSGIEGSETKLVVVISQITFISDQQKIIKGPWIYTIDLEQ